MKPTVLKVPLYQVSVVLDGVRRPVTPMIAQAVCDEVAAGIRKEISSGKLKGWADPQVSPVLNLG